MKKAVMLLTLLSTILMASETVVNIEKVGYNLYKTRDGSTIISTQICNEDTMGNVKVIMKYENSASYNELVFINTTLKTKTACEIKAKYTKDD